MRADFHETYTRSEVKPPSERSTGLLFAVVAVLIAVLWRSDATVLWLGLGLAAILAAVGLIAPALLQPLNILWFRFGLLLHRIVSPVVMFVMFASIFVPAGAIMRLWGDPLRLRRLRPGATSYWIERRASESPGGSMRNQF